MNVPWPMTGNTYSRYLELLSELGDCHPEFEYEKYQELLDSMQTLPEFPKSYDPQEDVIVPVLRQSLTLETIERTH